MVELDQNLMKMIEIPKQSRYLYLFIPWDGTGVCLCHILKVCLVQSHCFVQIKTITKFGAKIFTLGKCLLFNTSNLI